jgi:hypothetical protein
VVDWDELHQAQLSEKELSKHLKKKTKYLAKKAKKEAAEAAEAAEAGSKAEEG